MAKRQVDQTVQTRLGELEVDLQRVLTFPRGLIGFEDCKRFTLLQLKEDSPFLILQSLDRPELGLMVADPYCFMTEYNVKIGSAEQKLLNLDNVKQLAVLVTVTIPKGRPAETALNLMGPILVNYEARLGLQVPQVDSKYSSRFMVSDINGKKTAPPLSEPQGESDLINAK